MRGCCCGARTGQARLGRGPGGVAGPRVPPPAGRATYSGTATASVFPTKSHHPLLRVGREGQVLTRNHPCDNTCPPHPGGAALEGSQTTENILGNGFSWQRRNRPGGKRVPVGATVPWCPDIPITFGWLPPTQAQHAIYWAKRNL